MDILSIAVLLGLLFVKEAGVPIPVPGDLLVLGAGVATASQPGLAVAVLAAILVAGYAGGGLQFGLVRGALRRAILGAMARFGIPRSRIDAIAARLSRHGARGVAVARATPGIRVGAIAASGLAGLPYRVFLPGLAAGNAVFVSGHFALGFLIGPPALAVAGTLGGVAAAVIVVAAFAGLGAVGWLLLRRRRRPISTPVAAAAEPLGTGFEDWADAACPACLALTFGQALRARS